VPVPAVSPGPLSPSDTVRRFGRRRRLLVSAYVLALLAFSMLGLARPLWTPDEPREAEISREMYIRPTVIPTLDAEKFYEKPPLYYWTVAGVFHLVGGPSVAAARAVSGVAGFLTLLLILAWGFRLGSPATGVVASAALALSVQFATSTHWVLIDPMLMLACTVATWMAWEAVSGGGAFRFVLPMYGALAVALWIKGPVGPVMLGAGLTAYCILCRRERPWRRLRPLLGIGLLAAAMLALVLALYLAGGRTALWEWGWVNHVQRFLDARETGLGHQQPPWYYLQALPVAVLPWLGPLILVFVPRTWRASSETLGIRRFCAAVVVGELAVLSLAATKRETYLLPALPVLLLLLTLTARAWWGSSPSRDRFPAAAWAQAAGCALLAVVPPVAVIVYSHTVSPAAGLGLAVAVSGAAALTVLVARARAIPALAAAIACAAIGFAGALVLLPPALHRDKDFTDVIAAVGARFPAGTAVPAVGADETLRGIVPFGTGRALERLSVDDLAARHERGLPLPGLLVVQTAAGDTLDPRLESLYRRDTAYRIGPRRRIELMSVR
jgi:4-amino-4-deoxy-L-arabinose transferase-like glycosyltransferase